MTTYFAAPEPPVEDPILVLDGEGTGPANHVAVVSSVAPGYAPDGAHLISVSGVDDAAEDARAFEEEAPRQLRRWFGPSVDRWEMLRSYRIADALPAHPPGSVRLRAEPPAPDGPIVAGDHTRFGAIQGALLSGRHAAEAYLATRR